MRRLPWKLIVGLCIVLGCEIAHAQGAPHGGGGKAITIASGIGSSPAAAGMTLSAGTLTLQPADATHPGAMAAADYVTLHAATNANTASAIVQRDGGGNFSASGVNLSGNIKATGFWQNNTSTFSMISQVADGSSTIAYTLDTANGALSNAAAKLVSFKNNAVEASFIHATGLYVPPSVAAASLPTCDATHLMGSVAWDSTNSVVKVCTGSGGWKTVTSI
jgi:hypothetical protein